MLLPCQHSVMVLRIILIVCEEGGGGGGGERRGKVNFVECTQQCSKSTEIYPCENYINPNNNIVQ